MHKIKFYHVQKTGQAIYDWWPHILYLSFFWAQHLLQNKVSSSNKFYAKENWNFYYNKKIPFFENKESQANAGWLPDKTNVFRYWLSTSNFEDILSYRKDNRLFTTKTIYQPTNIT